MSINQIDKDLHTKGFYSHVPRTIIVPMPDPSWPYINQSIPNDAFLKDQDVLHGLPIGVAAIGGNATAWKATKQAVADTLHALPDGGAVILQLKHSRGFLMTSHIYGSGKTPREALDSGSYAADKTMTVRGKTITLTSESDFLWIIRTSRPVTPIVTAAPAPAAPKKSGRNVIGISGKLWFGKNEIDPKYSYLLTPNSHTGLRG